MQYTVEVSNIGTVYSGDALAEATKKWEAYYQLSCDDIGRAGGQAVILCNSEGDPIREHFGSCPNE